MSRVSQSEVYWAWKWHTYGDIEYLARSLGTAMINEGFMAASEFPNEKYAPARSLELIGICAVNRLEWFLTDLAASTYSFTMVPLYDTLGDESLNHIMKLTTVKIVFGGSANLENILEICKANKEHIWLEKVVSFDSPSEKLLKLCEEVGTNGRPISVCNFWKMIANVKNTPLLPPKPPGRASVSTICFTSGTTGVPKGAILTHGMFAASVCGAIRGPLYHKGLSLSAEDSYFSYLPLAHVLERILCAICFSIGAKVLVYSGDSKILVDDIKLGAPTVFASVPRLFNRIYDNVEAKISSCSLIAKSLLRHAVDTKLKKFRANGQLTHSLWDPLIFNRIQKTLGGKLRYMISGGAPIDINVQENLSVLFSCPFVEGYGLTETLGASFIRRGDDPVYGHIGGPLPCVEFKLLSVPEMNYDATTAPYAGELCLAGPSIFPGYFLNPEATEQAFTEENFFMTGDIAVRLEDGGRVKIIDRKKNILKLAQGEYVSPERIELVYLECPYISQIFVYGDSYQSELVAILCPEDDEIRNRSEKEFRELVTKQLQSLGSKANLKGFEKVKIFHVEYSDPFSTENGLLTPTLKLKRQPAREKYASQIESMYDTLKSRNKN